MVLTPLAIWLGRRLRLTDKPNLRKVHSKPVPHIGGAAIFATTMSLILPVLFLPNRIGNEFRAIQLKLIVLLCASTSIFIVGLFDDIRYLRARTKLLMQIAAAMFVCFWGIRIESVVISDWLMVDFGWISWPLTILWIVGITNAVNLSDGLDGLAAGLSAIICGVIAVFAITGDQVVMAVLMIALLGALSGFLCFNFSPAKIFLGDCGSMFLGFIIASSSVLCFMKSSTLVGLTLPIVALGVPIFDTLFSMLRRFLARRSIFAADCYHFHHRLLRLGLKQRHAVIMIYVVTLLITGLGMFMLLTDDVATFVVFGCIIVLLLVLFRVVGSVHIRRTIEGLQRRYAIGQETRFEKRIFEGLQLQFEHARNQRNWWKAVCKAAEQLDFAWLSLRVTDENGDVHVFGWRLADSIVVFKDVITMHIPVRSIQQNISAEFEVAISKNGSLEAAARRASLFGRLIDEYKMPSVYFTDKHQIVVPSHTETTPAVSSTT